MLNNKRNSRTKLAFQEAFLTILEEQGLEKASITNITEAAGYTRASFYLHYQTKDELYEEFISETFSRMIQTLDSTPNEYKDPSDYHFYATLRFYNYIYENANFFKVMIGKNRMPGFISQLNLFLINYYRKRILIPIDNNEIDLFENELYLAYLSTATVGQLVYWIKSDMKYSPYYLANESKKIINEKPFAAIFDPSGMELLTMESPSMRPTQKIDRRIIRTKKMIKHSLLTLLSSKDYKNISIMDIVNEADINRTTFYSHYPDKQSLLSEITEELLTGMTEAIYTQSPKRNSKVNNFASPILINLFTYILENSFAFTALLCGKKAPGFISRLADEILKILNDLIEYYYPNKKSIHFNQDIATVMIGSAIQGVIVYWVHNKMSQPPLSISKQLTFILCEKVEKLYKY
ncbi:TetR/AcrR family transcriptional regulator [Neobacillus sp. 179-C4.2 HS]|uniref:TetR/AcrR family transcriptional regulator n=1 Tax=Neobacillus driksii TaxID=3035913 RepID=A0ABV4YVH9_9BACI|nr:TetR/AcrR family transcriptional regulator [Neobacillus sp. 179.-C4.2 HS]MDP5192697.1 TetR/AcrR family transcriptional regulator [Neobacillus sp. 179.-C4.2 HS]